SAASFCIAEGKRAGRAKSPDAASILGVGFGAGFIFGGSAAGVHLALVLGPDHAGSGTIFATLPIQALGYLLAWIGHKGLAPMAERVPTRRELMLVEGLLAAFELLLGLLALYVIAESKIPTAVVPVLVTLSIATTLCLLHVARIRWSRGERWY
ncbi:MAG: hypothetical protein ACAI25_11080, partial [Planctomycetota bacterium]